MRASQPPKQVEVVVSLFLDPCVDFLGQLVPEKEKEGVEVAGRRFAKKGGFCGALREDIGDAELKIVNWTSK